MTETPADGFRIVRVAAPGSARRITSLGAVVAVALLAATDAGVRLFGADATGLGPGLFSLRDLGPVGVDGAEDETGSIAVVVQGGGADNNARILGFGPVQALISQFGQGNQAEVSQNGSGLVSVVEQGRAPGATSAFEAELALPRGSGIDPFGGVSGNRAFIDQAGVDNRSLVGQFGSGGLADVAQRGSSNLSSIFQSGDEASAFVTQAGERNGSIIQQHDFSVRASIVQTGEDGLSEARQWNRSSGSEIRVFQAGSRAMSDIDQGGVRNLAMVVQWDGGERPTSTVIQDGDQGQVRVDQAGEELVSIVRQTGGELNGVEVYQAGLDNVSEITQSGIANAALTRQSGAGNRSTVVQSGSGNVAVVDQTVP